MKRDLVVSSRVLDESEEVEFQTDEPQQVLARRLSDDINARWGDRPWILAMIALACVFFGSLLSGRED